MPNPVSKILWHFTGGKPGGALPGVLKDEKDAFNILISILESRLLQVGNYKEAVSIPLANGRDDLIDTKKVCCVADIPIENLDHHSIRYGKFAIGFKRESLLLHPFNPVFYLAKKSASEKLNALRSIMVDVDYNCVDSAISNLSKTDGNIMNNHTIALLQDVKTGTMRQIRENLGLIMSYVKSFSEGEFDTIYAEREWRSTRDYNFHYNDVAMIIVPQKYVTRVNDVMKKFSVSIEVRSWETRLR